MTTERADLETIVTLLELAALDLTNAPGDVFTKDQLYDRAKSIGSPDIKLDDVDVSIVFNRMTHAIEKAPGGWRLK